jgi:hypothetical protein
MGGFTVSNSSGAEAIYYNPAGIAAYEKSELLFSSMSYIADINVSYIAGTFNGGEIGTFGLSIKSLDFGEIEETTEDMPDGTGVTYSPANIVAGVSYSRILTEKIIAGLTAKYVHESIMQTEASAFAIDLGVQYIFNRNLRLGVVMKNVGTKMQYRGRNLERQTEIIGSVPGSENGYYEGITLASNIPSVFSFGMQYVVDLNESNNVAINGSFSNLNEASDRFTGGLEYSFNDIVFLRGGYNYLSEGQDDNLFGASFGAGFKYQVGDFDLNFDYAYMQITEYFDTNHIFTIKFGL